MDFSGWFEAYLGGHWHTFDAQFNMPAHRSHPSRAGAGRGRCRDQHDLRPEHAQEFRGLGRRGDGSGLGEWRGQRSAWRTPPGSGISQVCRMGRGLSPSIPRDPASGRPGAPVVMELTSDGRRVVDELAQRHGVSGDAVLTLLRAVAAGNGTSAQFNHPELGGMGQWSQGGMVMVGDMFNNALKHRVDLLCSELAALVRSQPLYPAATGQSQSQSSGSLWQGSQGQSQGGSAGVSLFVAGSKSRGRWLVAGRARPAVVDRGPEQHPLCLLPGHPPTGHPASPRGRRLRHAGPPDLRLLAAAGRRRLNNLHQPARPRPRRRPPHRPSRRRQTSCIDRGGRHDRGSRGRSTEHGAVEPRSARAGGPGRAAGRGSWPRGIGRSGRCLRHARATGRPAPERHPDRGGIHHEEGRAVSPALTWKVRLPPARTPKARVLGSAPPRFHCVSSLIHREPANCPGLMDAFTTFARTVETSPSATGRRCASAR